MRRHWASTLTPKGPTGLASISVIIPAYNARETIGAAIESALQQTQSVQEVIVVDDGSTDDTAGLIERQFPSVRLERIANQGPSRARNYGLGLARGEWVAFLDADDRWHPRKIELQWQARQPGIGLIATDWLRSENFPPIPHNVPQSRLGYRELLRMNQFQTSTVLMERSLADRLGGFDASVDGAEDWDFWLRASHETDIVKLDWPLVQYRDVATGYSKDVWRVYTTMQPTLQKHRGTPAISATEFATLEAWQHLRFWVAFLMAKDRAHARSAWENAMRSDLRMRVPAAATRYLLPFLWARAVRRLKR